MGDKLSLTIIATGFSGEKREKLDGNEGLKKMDLYAKESGKTTVAKPKEHLPAGLTNRPVLLNRNLKRANETENPITDTLHPTTSMTDEQKVAPTPIEPVIKHNLEEEKTDFMAYKVEDTDDQMNAIIDAEAPEMIGTPVGEELPTFTYDDEAETTKNSEMLAESDSGNSEIETTDSVYPELPIAESLNSTVEMESILPEFPSEDIDSPIANTFDTELSENETSAKTEEQATQKTELRFGHSPEPSSDDETDTSDIITTETPTEVEFDLQNEATETEGEIKTFNLFEDTVETPSNKLDKPLSEEPKLITREQPLHNDFNSEEMQKKQLDRMEKLKSRMARFRSPSNLAELENVPAFKRRDVNLEDVPHSSSSSVTNLEVTDGNEDENKKGGLSNGNAFLHESVD